MILAHQDDLDSSIISHDFYVPGNFILPKSWSSPGLKTGTPTDIAPPPPPLRISFRQNLQDVSIMSAPEEICTLECIAPD
jgi:hypothetical protein